MKKVIFVLVFGVLLTSKSYAVNNFKKFEDTFNQIRKGYEKYLSEIQTMDDGRKYVVIKIPNDEKRTQAIYFKYIAEDVCRKKHIKIYSYSAIRKDSDIDSSLLNLNAKTVLGSWAKTQDGTVLFQGTFSIDSANNYIGEMIIMVGMTADNLEKNLLKTDEY